MRKWIISLVVVAGVAVAGCGNPAADHHAAIMDGLANQVNASTVAQLQDPNVLLSFAVVIENERRAARNLSDGLHWEAPTYRTAATRPTALPWTPKDANGR